MARRLVYVVTGMCLAGLVLFAVALLSEARLGLIGLAVALGAASWWLTRRLPARPASGRELSAWAVAGLALAVAMAVLIPSTQVFCDCVGPPQGVTRVPVCDCPADRHLVLRIAIAAAGVALALALAVAARRRARPRAHGLLV